MVEIKNIEVYELWESIIASRNAMRIEPAKQITLDKDIIGVHKGTKAEALMRWGVDEVEQSLKRAIKLASARSNSGHPNFLTGIRVSFDIKYPNYFTPELQRYNWIDIVTSNSKMHQLAEIVVQPTDPYNQYVTEEVKAIVLDLAHKFKQEPTYENRIKLLSNTPLGFEQFMRISTNYMQLRNIYHQRKNHRLKEDWGAFCAIVEALPFFNEFINPKIESNE